jgi:Zn-dependent protease with chaperone function
MLIRFAIQIKLYKPRKIKKTVEDEKLTKKLRSIVKDDSFHVYEVDLDSPNAYVTIKRNSLFYTGKLKEILTEDELIAVLLHEYNHHKNKHVGKNFAIIGSSYIMTFLIDKAIIEKLNQQYEKSAAGTSGIYYALALFYSSAVFMHLPLYIAGRRFEIKSDAYAAKMGYGDELVSALTKVYNYSPPEVDDSRWNSILKQVSKWSERLRKLTTLSGDVHPDLDSRIKNIVKTKEYQKEQEKYLKDLKKKKI